MATVKSPSPAATKSRGTIVRAPVMRVTRYDLLTSFLITLVMGLAVAVVWLIIAGGVAYTLGAVVYGFKRPNPSPRWFGFHEIFHSLTVVGFTTHYIAVSLATYALR